MLTVIILNLYIAFSSVAIFAMGILLSQVLLSWIFSTVAKPPWLLGRIGLVTQASKSKCSVVIWAQRFFMGMYYWKGLGLLKLCSLELLCMSSALPPPMKPSLTTFWRQVVLSLHLLGWNKWYKVWMASSFECMSHVSFSEAQGFSLYLFGHLPTL